MTDDLEEIEAYNVVVMRCLPLGALFVAAFLCFSAWDPIRSAEASQSEISSSDAARELFQQAEVQRTRGALEEAKTLYRESIRSDPDYPPAYRFLGETLLRLGENRAAVQILEEAVNRWSDDVHLLLALGVAYGPEGRIAESIQTLRKVVTIDPKSVLGWVNLGASLEQMGTLDEARKAFEKALELNPSLVFAHYRLGRLLLAAGEPTAAGEYLKRALELDPDSTEAGYYLSRVLRSEGRSHEADALFHEVFGLPPPDAPASPKILARGGELAARYCSTCHLQPRPDLLPRRTWPFVMAWMGNYLGFKNLSEPFANLVSRAQVPSQPLLSRDEFDAIYHYFWSAAPPQTPAQKEKPDIKEGAALFEPAPWEPTGATSPWITLVHIDEKEGRLFVGEGLPSRLSVFSRDGKLLERFPLDSQPVAVESRPQGFDLTLIGDFDMDRRRGQVIRFWEKADGYTIEAPVKDYFRSSYSRFADLTGDGRDDLVVCGFGDFDRGRTAWFENLGSGRFEEHVLIDRSGALRTEIHDFTSDGRPDLLVLMAQGRNELIFFENLGRGRFRSRQLMEQSPGFGYNDFLVADFNNDNHLDLLTVNGNNMEIEDPPLRNYHGIRIYLNDGRMSFTEAYFYAMYGALRAVAADFNGNGHLDVAAVSFFPDWEVQTPETFVFLENQGKLKFQPYTIEEAEWGRWLSLAAGDLTGDGRQDLVLGNALFLAGIPPRVQSRFVEKFENSPRVLILKGKKQ